jgi:hypothetical protein
VIGNDIIQRLVPARAFFTAGLRAGLALFALVLAGIGVAQAQYYGGEGAGRSVCVTSRGNCDAGYAPPGTGCGCNIPGFGPKRGQVQARYRRPPPDYAPRPRYEDDGYAPRRRYRDDGYVVTPRQRAYGSTCVTARGNCSIGRPVPLPAGCVCNIPGFGKKRGQVQ